ncbi:MAG TPA: M56 family peptidase [Salinimicrobium catena]|uniref:M56 family peptidase n=1 Tax=Salinimicrobium catena TaxID=390640 RepID=A0A7C2RCB9_9FLAO|nr:M56 family peptidase [Salinimicrobium catena]
MEEAIVHLLKSAGLMTLFYAGYFFLLKNDTSFKTNRFFLLAGIITSILLPFLEITQKIIVENTDKAFLPENFSAEAFTTAAARPEAFGWWQISGILYLAGLSFFLLKFFLELFSLLKIILTQKTIRKHSYCLIHKSGSHPFSFFRYIILDPGQHSPREIDLILKHEQAHVRQGHSIDQLLATLFAYLLWFHPLAWLYRKGVVQNLEYLADREVVSTQDSKKEYQKTLLKISIGGAQFALTNLFYQSLIKKRIIMLNKNTTKKSNFWKTGILLPLLALFIFFFNVKTEAQEKESSTVQGSETEITAYITKTSDKKSLNAFKKLFQKKGIELKFDDVNFEDGILTSISVSFKKPSGTNGNLSLNNPEGISPLMLYTDGEIFTMTPVNSVAKEVASKTTGSQLSKPTGFETQKISIQKEPEDVIAVEEGMNALEKENVNGKIYSVQETEPLVVINGVERQSINSSEVNPSNIKEIKILKGEGAVEKYGKGAENGAVEIALKSEGELQEKTFSSETNSEPVTLRMSKIRFKERKKLSVRDVGSAEPYVSNRLYVVDGKIMDSDFDPDSIAPEDIESINVLKGEKATAKYGKKASDGAIEITIKE